MTLAEKIPIKEAQQQSSRNDEINFSLEESGLLKCESH